MSDAPDSAPGELSCAFGNRTIRMLRSSTRRRAILAGGALGALICGWAVIVPNAGAQSTEESEIPPLVTVAPDAEPDGSNSTSAAPRIVSVLK